VSEVLEIRKRAHEHVQAGDLDLALGEYRKLLKGEDVDPNIYNLMGDVYFKKGEQAEAFHQYNEAVKRYAKESLYSNAIAVCRKMLRLDPTYIDAHRLLGELYIEQGFSGEAVGYLLDYSAKLIEKGHMERAAEALRRVIEFAPGRVKIREQLADVYQHLGFMDEARSELLAAGEIHEQQGEGDQAARLRQIAEGIGGSAEAMESEIRVEGEGADRVEIVHKRIGLAHHVPLKIEEVLSSFQEEVKKAIGEEDYQCHYDLGLSYLDLGFYDEALAEFGVARRMPELELSSIEMVGHCFVEKGDIELAIEELKAGLETEGHSDEDFLGLRYNLALAYEKLGQVEEASKQYEQVHSIDPTFKDVKTRIEELREQHEQ
jgi:tetratricopeptide (TPR) repeat protein